MGIVFKQSFKNLSTTYLGIAIGAVNVLLLYPHFMSKEYYGVVTAILSTATLLTVFVRFGVPNTLVKFFSSYKGKAEQDGLLGFALIAPLLSGIVFGVLGIIFYGYIVTYFGKSPAIEPFIGLIFLISIANAYFLTFFNWAKLKLKTVFGNFMFEVFHRVLIALMLLMISLEWITVEQFIYSLVGVYVLRMLIMMGYAFYLLPPKFKFRLPGNFSILIKYSVLISVVSLAAGVLLDLDKTMIPHFMAIGNVAVYAIAVYIASVIEVPVKAMRQITYPLTATYLNTKNWPELNTLYKKSSISLLVISGLIFILIVCNINQFYTFLPKGYHIEITIVVLLGLMKLVRNLAGINGSILLNSDYYRWLLFLGVATVLVAVVLNYVMIPAYGLMGAAVATFFTVVLSDLFKIWLVYRKFNAHPFSKKTAALLGVIAVMTVLFYFIRFDLAPIPGILIKSAVISIIYGLVVYFSNFSEDVTAIVDKFLKK